jgi:hypothetical protein
MIGDGDRGDQALDGRSDGVAFLAALWADFGSFEERIPVAEMGTEPNFAPGNRD